MEGPNSSTVPTLGVLYPGELGATLGRLLRMQGHHVVTTVQGRSARTEQRARSAGLEILESTRAVVEAADILFAVVPPAAAAEVAATVSSCPLGERKPRLYVDLNAIAPATTTQIGDRVTRAGFDFVDGAVHGLAAQLPDRGTLYLSGPSAPWVAALFGRSVRVQVLGDRPGQASAFKMMISGMAKGVVALFLEMSLAARQAGVLDDLLACYREAYPGIMALVDRMLPTYPRHAARRGDELGEVEQTLASLGLQPCLVHGARRLTTAVGRLGWAEPSARGDADWPVAEVIETIFAHNPLRGAPGEDQLERR
ncbi:MAG: NAD(P)-dependent oxidoreductase [Planctomycetes bacterium]|nr:NAD(P)-dependent oxidoreductase [Planctomycetota bacterium]